MSSKVSLDATGQLTLVSNCTLTHLSVVQSASDAASEALAARLQAEQDAALAQQLEDERLAMAHDPWQQAEQEWDSAMKQVGTLRGGAGS
jgi:hypothetical protein